MASQRWTARVEGGAVLVAVVAAAWAWLILLATPLLLFLTTFLLRRRGRGWHDLGLRRAGFRPGNWGRALLLAVALIALGWFVLRPLCEWVTRRPLDVALFERLGGDAWGWALMVGLSWTYAAFGEELLFRGFAMDRLRAAFPGGGWLAPALVQAAAFGLAHAYQGPAGVLLTGLIGLALAGIYLRSGRDLALVVLTHGLVDTLVLTGFWLGF